MAPEKPLPWYKAPIVWLGVFLTLLVLAGCIHMIMVGHQASTSEASTSSSKKDEKALTHILGMPLSRDASNHDNTAEDNSASSSATEE